MEFSEINSLVGHVPFISKKNAEYLYQFILKEKPKRILELGIAHGTATCFMAAALQKLGGGSITSVDLLEAEDEFKPPVLEQLAKTGLSEYVNVIRKQTGYTWFLHDEIAKHTKDDTCEPVYDLCIIDGPKNWTVDGAAFFMVDKLLKENGWIIFDDYNWTYSMADKMRDNTDGIAHRKLSEDERNTPHIRDVFELLVKQHPDYGNFVIIGDSDWALAQKTKSEKKNYNVIYRETSKDVLVKIYNKLKKLFA